MKYFTILSIIIFSLVFISCEQTTEPSSSVPELKILGQTLTGMIVHTTEGPKYYVTNETLLAWGGAPLSSYAWSVANLSALPVGTSINPLTGIFHTSGGTLVKGTHNFKLTVSDGSKSVDGNLTFIVEEYQGFGPSPVFQQPLGMFNIYLPDAYSGHGYGATLWALGSGKLPWSWFLESGALPQGMVIDQANGIVRGTPHSSAAGNEYSFTVTVKDKDGETAASDQLTYHIKVVK
jgi:hypothetical protein